MKRSLALVWQGIEAHFNIKGETLMFHFLGET